MFTVSLNLSLAITPKIPKVSVFKTDNRVCLFVLILYVPSTIEIQTVNLEIGQYINISEYMSLSYPPPPHTHTRTHTRAHTHAHTRTRILNSDQWIDIIYNTCNEYIVRIDFWFNDHFTFFLTLKAPPIICSRRQFQILPLFQNNNNAWYFMRIVCWQTILM